MMIATTLSFLGLISLLAGFFFLYRWYRTVPSPQSVVPRKDHEALEKSLSVLRESEAKAKIEAESTKAELEKFNKNLQDLRQSEDLLRQELNKTKGDSKSLLDNLERQLLEQTTVLEQQKNLAEQQKAFADEQKVLADKEKAAKEDLKAQLDMQKDSLEKFQPQLNTFQERLNNQIELNKKLESELNEIKQKGGQRTADASMLIARIKDEKETMQKEALSLKNRLEEALRLVTELNLQAAKSQEIPETQKNFEEYRNQIKELAVQEKKLRLELTKKNTRLMTLERIYIDTKQKIEILAKTEEELRLAKAKIAEMTNSASS